jgi:3-dehydroquinate synthetase
VNLEAGKNLAGTWHQPLAVFCDTKTLRSLPEAELRSGLAEVVKYGLIAAPDLLRLVAERADEIFNREQKVLRTIVTRSAGIKAEIVSADEREQGKRAWLNYGHTLGHAIEHLHGGRLRHGEAIALGMMAAAYIAEDSGRIDEEAVTLHRTTLEAVGLPVRASLELEALQGALTRDKKYEGGVRFVLLEGLAQPRAGVPVGMDEIERALKRMAE